MLVFDWPIRDLPGKSTMTETLQGETLIYFGPDPWFGLWRNRHHLMSRFAADNDVWYVEPPANLRKLLTGRSRRDKAGRRYRSRLFTRDTTGVRVFHGPWWLPTTGRAPFKGVTLRLYFAVLGLATGSHKRKPIVWFSRPNMLDYVDKLAAKLTIYHVVDEYSGYDALSDRERETILLRESELLRRVDIIIAVSESLVKSKSSYNRNIYHVPNAVDFTAYAARNAPVPADIVDIPHPIVGYSGLIAARLDLKLLYAAAESRPNWSYVFVGLVRDDHCQEEIRRLRELPNVYLLGQKAVVETTAYVQQFDVCTIPYLINLRAQNASPLKLYEYAAASKPIVATNFTAARTFEGHIHIARDTDEFLAACEQCLQLGPESASIVENRRVAENNTWNQRVEMIADILQDNLSR